ncbi:MAG: hypothetical protein ACK41D_07075 [Rubricoccaceae bacterium]
MTHRAGVPALLLALLLALPLARPAAAQAVAEPHAHEVCRLHVPLPGEAAAPPHGSAPAAPHEIPPGLAVRVQTCPADAPRAPVEVIWEGFPAAAQAAVQAAVDTWACRIASPVTIRVRARWTALGANTLGSAGPFRVRDFPGAPLPGTFYPTALASALVGRDLTPAQPHIASEFNSAFGRWHLDPDTPPPADRFDLYTVALHELGHGLGIIGTFAVEDGIGTVGGTSAPAVPSIYDRFGTDAAGRPLFEPAYPNASRALAEALQDDVRFSGRAARATYGAPVPLHAPRPWVPGGSFSHLREQTFGAGTPDGLMTPFIASGERITAPGAATCAILADLGWTLAGPCLAATVPDVPAAGWTLARRGPNPFRERTQFDVLFALPQRFRATLYDARGRVVAEIAPEQAVAAGAVRALRVEAAGLAAGVYFLRLDAESRAATLPLTVVR